MAKLLKRLVTTFHRTHRDLVCQDPTVAATLQARRTLTCPVCGSSDARVTTDYFDSSRGMVFVIRCGSSVFNLIVPLAPVLQVASVSVHP